MSFQCRDGGRCQFFESDLKTMLPARLRFIASDKIVEFGSDFFRFPISRFSQKPGLRLNAEARGRAVREHPAVSNGLRKDG